MTTIRQVKAWLTPLLQQHKDLALVGRLLVVKPVNHILRAVLIDRTSSANRFRPLWFIHHLCDPRGEYHISWGEKLTLAGGRWDADDPEMPALLRKQIETVALPNLRPIITFEDYLAAVSRHGSRHLLFDVGPSDKVVVDVAMGDLTAARQLCMTRIAHMSNPKPEDDGWTKAMVSGAKLLCGMLAQDDYAGLIRTLHGWEAMYARNLKLTDLWQPSPFPIELKA